MENIQQKKKLTIVSSYAFVDTNATKARLSAYLSVLQNDYDVTFICPHGETKLDIPGISIVQVGQSPVHGGFLTRSVREILYALRTIPKVRSSDPNLTMVTMPSMFVLLLLAAKQSPTIVDVRDLVWEYLPENSSLGRVIKSTARTVMLGLLNKSDAVFVTNESEQDYFLDDNLVANIPIQVVRNGINQDRFEKLSTLGLSHDQSELKILYIGNIGRAQNLRILVDAMKSTPNARAIIVGKGNDLANVKQYAADAGVQNVEFVGGVQWDQLAAYYEEANVLYAQISSEYQSAVPSKLYEYLSVGLPIIFAGVGASATLMKDFENVSVIRPDDATALTQAIHAVQAAQSHPASNKNQERIKSTYVRETQVEKVLPMLRDLVQP